VILFAGCAVNFLLSLISYLLGYEMLTEINLALALFNLLPFSYFDGGRIIGLYAPETLRKTLAAVCTAMLAAAFIKVGKISPAAALVLLFAAISEIFM
jgi:Zn-dependent protease